MLIFVFALISTINVFANDVATPISNSKATVITTGDTQEQPVQPQPKNDLEVHFIDVGQGDSILVLSPNGSTMLIDAGTQSSGEKIVSYLKKAGISTIDKFIATHPHSDHIGGAQDIFKNFEVKKVYDSGFVHTSQMFENYLLTIKEKGIPFVKAERGKTINLDSDLDIKILHPGELNDANNSSVVLHMKYNDVSFLFTGDAEKEAEESILEYAKDIQAKILKVGHHGSDTSTTQTFLNTVNPEVAVIQVGTGNTYGHPTNETLNKLSAAWIKIYRNDLQGDIVVTTDGKTYSISAQPFVHQTSQQNESETVAEPVIDVVSSITGRININTASLEELQEIIHIGPAYAQRIIELRPYTSIKQLTGVDGIGAARLKDIIEEGKAYVD